MRAQHKQKSVSLAGSLYSLIAAWPDVILNPIRHRSSVPVVAALGSYVILHRTAPTCVCQYVAPSCIIPRQICELKQSVRLTWTAEFTLALRNQHTKALYHFR
jgi:hypothetical protein